MDLEVGSVFRPKTLEEALELLAADPGLRPIAGGTDVVVQLRDGRMPAAGLVDLSALDLVGIRETADGIEIGAATSMDEITRSPLVRAAAPALAEAAGQVGAWPIQCRATLGGNLGNASPAADTAPPLIAAGAEVVPTAISGERRLPVEELFLGPGQTALAPGELIRSVAVPAARPAGDGRVVERFAKLGPRREQIISVVVMALRATVAADGTIIGIRIAVGSVAPTPVRARAAEASVTGRRPDARVRREAARALQDDISPIDDVRAPARYRRITAAVLLDRLLEGTVADGD